MNNNKVIIITGALGFLGKKYTYYLAENNYTPVIIDLNKSKVKKFADSINKKFNLNATGYFLDITNEKKVKDTSKKILKKYGKIDVLINNATNNPKMQKLNHSFRLENFKISDWNLDLSVGLTGSFLCSKYFGNIISKNLKGGSIINISSDLGLISPDHRIYNKNKKIKIVKPISYSVVKSGIIGLTRYLATYWPGIVRSNALCLGGVYDNQDKDFVKKLSKLIPLGRMAESNEYLGIIKFLCSDESSYLNGAIIPVDGGRTVW